MQLDYNILMFINGLTGHIDWLDKLMANFSQYGPLLFGLYLVGLWFTGGTADNLQENRKNTIYAVLAALLAIGINQIIGAMWYRNRPYVDHPVNRLVPANPDAAFPSDHAAGSFSIAASILACQSGGGTVLTVLALLLSLSRVYVGVHYPSDVLGGMIVGIISSMVVNRNRNLLERPVTLVLTAWNFIETNIFSSGERKLDAANKN